MALPPPPAWAHELVTVGVTGTNGKTTTTLMIGAALEALGPPVARVTTLGSFVEGPFAARPDHGGFIAIMAEGRARGARFAAIELTSEALARGYARAWPCRFGVFTNFTRDHLDAHGSPEHYLASKAQLFMHLPSEGAAILNAADPASELLDQVIPSGVRRLRYGISTRGAVEGAELIGYDVGLSWGGTRLSLAGCSGVERLTIRSIGAIFAENALAALAAAIAAGVPACAAAEAIAALPPTEGRFEVVAEEPFVVVDYAHTPDALRRTIATARALARGRVVVIFGAGGERDREKRPLMGAAARDAEAIVVTSDNPRREDPEAIARAITAGIDGEVEPRIELDRGAAITRAVVEAARDDVVVIAGKGHEKTQAIGEIERPFSDAEVARRAHRAR